MKLTGKQLNHLRALAHHLKPIVTVGVAGATPAVSAELENALEAHELVKIRLPSLPKPEKRRYWPSSVRKQTLPRCNSSVVSV